MTQTTLSGSCLCGAVRYEATGEPKRFVHCHCSRCRKATGTGHASNLFLQPGALRLNDRVLHPGMLLLEALALNQLHLQSLVHRAELPIRHAKLFRSRRDRLLESFVQPCVLD